MVNTIFGTMGPVTLPSINTPSATRIEIVDTSTQPDTADLPLYVTLHDRAGNESILTITNVLYVDQSTDIPVIALTNLNASVTAQADAADNWLTGSSITGTITDDDVVADLDFEICNTSGTAVKGPVAITSDLTGAGG